ncbi:hypothetical protein HYC85_028585 [Camellia sinensis]|uniref:Uncharacterized protein n=1 Tax=Camellia sinensis TaxID=4442 RepID=A0A7J7FZL2_CAMSI|nr:hypothetical protein HYC85_028585 [Camellia sinensis]
MLRKYELDPSHMLDWTDLEVDKDASYEERPVGCLVSKLLLPRFLVFCSSGTSCAQAGFANSQYFCRTLVPYPLISVSDIFGDNLGLAEITSASRPGHVAPRLTLRRHLATC